MKLKVVWDVLQLLNVHTKIHDNRSSGPRFKIGGRGGHPDTNRQHVERKDHILFPLKEGDYIKSTNISNVVLKTEVTLTGGTNYGLDGPGVEYRWRRDFSNTSRPALGPTQHSV
jgi:hypothetical protein